MKKIVLIFISCVYIVIFAVNLASIAQPISNNEYAIANLESEIQKNKGDKGAYMGLCYYYILEKQYDKLYAIMEKINKIFKNDESILNVFNQYTKDFVSSGNLDIAEKISKITIKSYNNDPITAIQYSEVLAKKYNTQAAIRFLKDFSKKTDKKQLIYDSLITYSIYDRSFDQGLQLTREIQKDYLNDISYYFFEALFLQLINKNDSIKYFQAYLDKLDFSSDMEERIIAAKLILSTLQKSNATEQDYISLIKYLKKANVPDDCILVQAFYARQLFPRNKYFLECLQNIYSDNKFVYKE